MASIDHTCMIWRNGEYLPNGTGTTYTYDEITDKYTSLLPFEYGRDGNIVRIVDSDGVKIDIRDDTVWGDRGNYWAHYERDGLRWGHVRWWTWGGFVEGLKWTFHKMRLLYHEYEVGVYKRDGIEVYIYKDESKQSYVSFYKDSNDVYVILGGYGHCGNVYCHFMSRGYGEEFEKKMLEEAYEWIAKEIVSKIADAITDDWDEQEKMCKEIRKVFKMEDER